MDMFVFNRNKQGRGALCALICALAIAMAPSVGIAGEGAGTAKEGGLGTAAALTSLIYGPVKIIYATGGVVIAGMAWMFSGGDSEVASTVLTRAVRGTYVVTPATLTGQEEIEFVGRSPEYRESGGRNQVAAAPDGW
jgi:hypothetical protein